MSQKVGNWILACCLLVVVQAIILFAIGSAIKRGNEADSVSRAQTAYVNILTNCADRNDGITGANQARSDSRDLRNVVVDFANKAAAARRASGDRAVALGYEKDSDAAAALRFKDSQHISCLEQFKRPRGVTQNDIPKPLLARVRAVDASSPSVP